MSITNNTKSHHVSADLILRAKHNPIMIAGRCPIQNCNRRTSHILYFFVGPNLNIRSFYAALCERHAEEKKAYYEDRLNRETEIVFIEDINKRTRERGEDKNIVAVKDKEDIKVVDTVRDEQEK